MKMRRRKLVAITLAAVAAAYLPWKLGARPAEAFAQTPTTIKLFGTDLRGIGTIGVAAPDSFPAPVTGVTHYTINIDQFQDLLVPSTSGLGLTTLRGYNPQVLLAGQNDRHLGGIIVGKGRAPGVAGDTAQPIQITFRNRLPFGMHIIPNDQTIMGANQGNNRTATHLHGGLVPWISDGGPFDWWDPNGNHGVSFLNNTVLNPGAAANEAEYYYPLGQSARLVWYHDHAFGITRINAYAGIATALLLRDAFEAGLVDQGLPNYIEKGGNEIPIVVQDKIFVGPNISTVDPTWANVVAPEATATGSLWYAHEYDTARYGKLGPNPLGVPPNPSVVPEYFGDTMLANGTTYPQVTVEARRYRFRILNACNARFLNLQMYVDDGTKNGITLDKMGNPTNLPALNAAAANPKGKPTSNWFVLGNEGGFLPNPTFVASNTPFNGTVTGGSLLLAPAERADVLFDFSAHAGQSIILYTDSPAPFPGGDPANDYFPGLNTNKNPVNAVTPAGFGPNTRVIMRFNVVPATSADAPLTITKATDLTPGNDPLLVPLGSTAVPTTGVAMTRQLTLNETFDGYGRLIQKLGTNLQQPDGTFGMDYLAQTTETPKDGTTEVWQITNLTADTHPIHFHLVNVQVISRQPFGGNFNGTPNLMGAPVPPATFENGWKETVRMNPGEVTTVIMKFKLPQIVNASGQPVNLTAVGGTADGMPPVSPRTGGYEYVWHCHILEHEEHDMMRPLVVSR